MLTLTAILPAASVRFNTRMFWADQRPQAGAASALCRVLSRGCRLQARNGSQRTSSRSSPARATSFHGRGQQLHYNWKYKFIRPTIEEVCVRYKAKHTQGVVYYGGLRGSGREQGTRVGTRRRRKQCHT
eukprot:4996945-Prymnesium_polylepis.1